MHRRRLAAEEGSFLVEVLVTGALVLVIGLGVLLLLEGAEASSAQNRARAVAANLAEAELDHLRARPLAEIQNLGAAEPRTVTAAGGEAFEVAARTEWRSSGGTRSTCNQDGSADVLKLVVTVTPQRAGGRPVVLESIYSPSARAAANQGAIAVRITDRAGAGVGGLPVSAAGPQAQSGTTDEAGCVVFAYLPAGRYTLAFGRAGWVDAKGREAVAQPVDVVAERTSVQAFRYDVAQRATVRFWAQRTYLGRPTGDDDEDEAPPPVAGATNDTAQVPAQLPSLFLAHAEGDASRAVPLPASPTATTTLTGLFPFTSAYALWGGSCAPPAPPLGRGALTAGVTPPDVPVAIRVPALDVLVLWRGAAATPPLTADRRVVVTTDCGERIERTQFRSTGPQLADPGFPYGTNLTVCAEGRRSEGWYSRTVGAQRNDQLAGRELRLDLYGATRGRCT